MSPQIFMIFKTLVYISAIYVDNLVTPPLKVRYNQKADWRTVDSPKKRTDEFDLFAVKSKKANKTNSFVRFLGESMARPNCLWF